MEYYRSAGEAFGPLLERIDTTIVEVFERLEVTAEGVDWQAQGLRGPSSTWTYLVSDDVFRSGTFQALAHRPALGLWGVAVLGPLLFAWALAVHWRRWRRGAKEISAESPAPPADRCP